MATSPFDTLQQQAADAQEVLRRQQALAFQRTITAQANADVALMRQGSAAVLAAWQAAVAANATPHRIQQLKDMYSSVLRKEAASAPLPTDSRSLLAMLQDAQLKQEPPDLINRIQQALDVAKTVEDKTALDASKDLASRPLPTDAASLQKLLTQAKDQNRTADAARLQAALADAVTRDSAAVAMGVSPMPASKDAGADPVWMRLAAVAALTAPFWLTALLTSSKGGR